MDNTVKCAAKKSDFSIEHILNKAGNKNEKVDNLLAFSWLQCTRYCPPKLPRSQKKDGPQKRQLGRHPRIPFSSQQLAVLEEKFKESPYLSSAEVTQISRTLQLADIRVKIWFQNRRARERREKQEQEVQQLKPYTKETKNVNYSPEHTYVPSNVRYTEQQSVFHQTNPIFANSFISLPANYEVHHTNFDTIRHFVNQNQL